MLNGITGTWWRWSEQAAGPQHRIALLSYVTCSHRAGRVWRKALGAAGWKQHRQQGLAWHGVPHCP